MPHRTQINEPNQLSRKGVEPTGSYAPEQQFDVAKNVGLPSLQTTMQPVSETIESPMTVAPRQNYAQPIRTDPWDNVINNQPGQDYAQPIRTDFQNNVINNTRPGWPGASETYNPTPPMDIAGADTSRIMNPPQVPGQPMAQPQGKGGKGGGIQQAIGNYAGFGSQPPPIDFSQRMNYREQLPDASQAYQPPQNMPAPPMGGSGKGGKGGSSGTSGYGGTGTFGGGSGKGGGFGGG